MQNTAISLMRDTLRNYDIYISENELVKQFEEIFADFKKRQSVSGEVICMAFDKILNNSGEKLHSIIHLVLFACDRFEEDKKVVFGQSANDALNLKLGALKELVHEILQYLTPSTVFSNVFSKLMHDKEQAVKEKPENLAG